MSENLLIFDQIYYIKLHNILKIILKLDKMANSKSAEKRIKINKRNRRQNRYYKTSVKNLTKKFLCLIESSKFSTEPINKKELENIFYLLCSVLDKSTKRNVFHKNTAARKKARLSKQFKSFQN